MLWLLTSLLFVTALSPVQAQDLDLTGAEKAWISDHPVIRVHNEMDWPPFNFNVNGQPSGFFIEYMNLVVAAAGLQAEYVSGPAWDQFLGMVRTGELDVMLNIVQTPERAEYLNFTNPILQTQTAVFVTNPAIQVRSLEDLHGKRVAVTEGFFPEEYLAQDHPEIELVLEPDTLNSLFAVIEGRADAILDDFAVTNFIINQRSLTGFRVAYMTRNPQYAVILTLGVRKDRQILRDILQKAIESLDPNVIEELREKWLGSEPEDDSDGLTQILSADERQWISEHPTIRVHNEMDWPPFNFNVNGQPTGYSIDFMNLVASRAGLQVEYISGPSWQEFLDMTQSGELDVMLNLSPTPERAEYLNFTEPYLLVAVAIVVNDPTLQVNSIQDLHGKKLAVPAGFFTAEILAKEHPEIELVLERDSLASL